MPVHAFKKLRASQILHHVEEKERQEERQEEKRKEESKQARTR